MVCLNKKEILEKYFGTRIGELLVAGGFLSNEELIRFLKEQEKKNKKIGELIVEEGLLDPFELEIALEIQEKLRNPKEAFKLCAGLRKRLGEILLKANKINSYQLEEALKIQEKTNEKLGEILIRLGYIKKNDLNLALFFQNFSDKPIDNLLKIGQILCKANIITKEQLIKAIELQKIYPHKKIGQILIELGYLDKEQLDWALNLQQKLIALTLAGLFAISNIFFIDIAEAKETVTPNASTKVTVVAHLKAFAKVNIKEKISTINITNNDIDKGYKEVLSALSFDIKTNTPNVYLTIQNNCNQFYEDIDIFLDGIKTKIGPMGAIILLKNVDRQYNCEMNLKFYLKKDIKPGIYPIPFTLSVEGI